MSANHESAIQRFALFPDDDAAAGLMGSQYQHLGYLYVLRGIRGEDGYIGNVVARQRLDAFVDCGGTVTVAAEADVAEVGLHKSGLQVRHADSRVGNVDAQTVGECFHGSLGGTVDIAAGVGCIASHAAVPMVAFPQNSPPIICSRARAHPG